MRNRVGDGKRFYIVSAVLISVLEYAWSFWYYRNLHLSNELISAAKVTAETLPNALLQHFVVNLPVLLVVITALTLGRQDSFAKGIGLTVKSEKKWILPTAFGGYLLELAAAPLPI